MKRRAREIEAEVKDESMAFEYHRDALKLRKEALEKEYEEWMEQLEKLEEEVENTKEVLNIKELKVSITFSAPRSTEGKEC